MTCNLLLHVVQIRRNMPRPPPLKPSFRYIPTSGLKLAFHDVDTDFSREDPRRHVRRARLELFLWQAERHADILATILARMSMSASWNASYQTQVRQSAVCVCVCVCVC